MFNSKKLKWGLFPLAISPIAIIASCANQTSDEQITTSEVQKLVDQEVERLATAKIFDEAKTYDAKLIESWAADEQLLLKSLINLKPEQFEYKIDNLNFGGIVNELDTQNVNIKLNFSLLVTKKETTKTTKEFDLKVKTTIKNDVIKPPQSQLSKILEKEKNRIENNQPQLKQNQFSKSEIDKIKQKPNELFKHFFNFVPMQYFQYQIAEFNLTNKVKDSANLSFKINARYWKLNGNQYPTFSTKTFTLPIQVIDDNANNLPPVADRGDYELKPKSTSENDLIRFDMKENPDVDLAFFAEESTQFTNIMDFMALMLGDQYSKFFNLTGELPTTWNWADQIYIDEFFDSSKPNQNYPLVDLNKKEITFSLQVADAINKGENTPDDTTVIQPIQLHNFKYTPNLTPTKPSVDQVWNQIIKDFEKLVKDVKLDEKKIHQAQAENVFQFANLTTNNFSDGFINYLLVDFNKFNKHYQNKIAIRAVAQEINYLTNTIKFKWRLEGNNEFSKKTWEDTKETIIKYQPSGIWQDQLVKSSSSITFPSGYTKLDNILDQHWLNPSFVDKTQLEDKIKTLGNNWTWKARELVSHIRFLFFQAFNNQASDLQIAIKGINDLNNLNQNPQGFSIMLKAKLNLSQDQNFIPFIQSLGAGNPMSATNFKNDDLITITFDNVQLDAIPSVVIDAGEIFPGFGTGQTWGKGFGFNQVIDDKPSRSDIYFLQMGTYQLKLEQNQNQLLNQKIVHRLLSLNLGHRYDFKDPLFKEPPLENQWIN